MAAPRILALILAGGEGGRLEVLTRRRAKPVMPYGGVYRLIDFALSNCMHSGLSDVWIVEQYEAHSLNEHLANGRPWDLDRTYGGLRVLPPFEVRSGDAGGFAAGNADALNRNLPLIRNFDPDLLLVLSADHVYSLDFRAVVDAHIAHDAELTAVTTRVPLAEAGRFGNVLADAEGRITDFAYKPDEPTSEVVTAEVFLYSPAPLYETLDALAAERAATEDPDDPGELTDYGHGLVPRLVARGRAWQYALEGYWRDVGTPESYWRSHMDLLGADAPFAPDDPAWPIVSYGVQRAPARIEGSARIERSLISPGCRVAGRVVRSVLAPGVVVEDGAEVLDAVVLGDTVIESGARVSGAIVDERVRIGSGASVDGAGPADEPWAQGDDLVLIAAGSSIAAGSRIGPGERVGAE